MTYFALTQDALDAGYRVEGHDSVTSTNTLAAEAAAQGDPGKLWIVARQQTAGRGRRGRPWQSAHGNLAASLLLRPAEPPSDQALLGFVAGVALSDALTPLLGGEARANIALDAATISGGRGRLALKWPNDVLADGAKLAGILLEAHADRSGRALIIGFGVNVVEAPRDTPYPATAFAELGVPTSAEALFERLATAWDEAHALWDAGRGRDAILGRWRALAAGMGGAVAVSRDGDILRGTLETVDDAGRLVVRDDRGAAHTISAGDVHFGMTAGHTG